MPPTVRLTADIFGRDDATIVFGWVVAAHQMGAAFAAYTAGALRTEYGTYAPAFVGAGVLCVIAAVGVLPIARRRPPGMLIADALAEPAASGPQG